MDRWRKLEKVSPKNMLSEPLKKFETTIPIDSNVMNIEMRSRPSPPPCLLLTTLFGRVLTAAVPFNLAAHPTSSSRRPLLSLEKRA